MSPMLVGILAYVLLQLLVVVIVSHRIRGEKDYLLAGRQFGIGFATFTIFATWFGAETVIGSAGAVYAGGLYSTVADPFGYTVCLFLMGLLFALPIWRRRLTTFADLFRERFSPGVEKLAVIMLVPTSIMWAAAQIRALGQVISTSSEFDTELAIALAAGVVIVYTVYGGLLADAVTDVIQGIVVMIGLTILLVAVIQAAGGIESAFTVIDPQRLNLFGGPGADPLATLERWAVPITGSIVAQELIAVILASRTPEIARRASLAGGLLYLLFGLMPVAIGLIGTQLLPGLADPEQLLPRIAQQHLATIPYVIFIGAVVSAILSTVASALLAAAALTAHNVIVPLRPQISPGARVRAARLCVVVAGIAAYVLARHSGSIYALVEQSSAFGGAGIFVILLFGLFTRFGGPWAATTALGLGVVVWLAGENLWHWPTPYLGSLAIASAAYIATAVLERRLTHGRG